ncbi:hypothetical protein [Lichenibacterium dinghuense]|uniref:hypothetical protein n=1 Tax=Lichenibacterium dinghuense TaxID=2895977 RepID=UPI001F2DD2AE|nr:hypothetical protein [Lichenibacterium sp. 6Y81]
MHLLLRTLQFQAVLAASALVAIAIPVIFIGVRESTKHQRRKIVEDLSTIFDRQDGVAAIPSFEFVKYKYNPDERRQARSGVDHDFKIFQWIVGIAPLCLFLFAMNTFSLTVVLHAAFKVSFRGISPWLEHDGRLPLFAWVVLSSFAGGLLFTMRAFKQAVNNFDMSPLSLVGAIVNLTFGPAVALLLVFSILKVPDAFGRDSGTALFPLVLVTAFAAGYYPEVAIRQLMRLSRLRGYKKFDATLYNEFKAIPVDVIDGIDAEIRARLSDYHIDSVQNLATANPLMLFVETPYGVYEIMDWVAQAQLCSSVGPQALLQLWNLGIRTIFDLERVALDPRCRDDTLTGQIGDILWSSEDYANARQAKYTSDHSPHPPLQAIEANIRMRIANPHALRLRQIFNQVSYSLGDDARRLPSVGRPSRRRFPIRRRPLLARRAGRATAAAISFLTLWIPTP